MEGVCVAGVWPQDGKMGQDGELLLGEVSQWIDGVATSPHGLVGGPTGEKMKKNGRSKNGSDGRGGRGEMPMPMRGLATCIRRPMDRATPPLLP